MVNHIIGIDEVGRGCLAGPVVVVAASVRGNIRNTQLGTLKDSKKLTKLQREAWFKFLIHNKQIDFALARVYPRQIEKRNISRAANLAASRAYERLSFKITKREPTPKTLARKFRRGKSLTETAIFLDGGLFIGSREKQPKQAKTIIKGDEKIPAVAIASIIAKVSRDRFMTRLAKKYPIYGFDLHKGYGTKLHRQAIAKYGVLPMHRLTFLR